MDEKESPVNIFRKHVDNYLWIRVQCCGDDINRLAQSGGDIQQIADLLVEANSWLDFFCEEDKFLYDSMRFRMFVDQETGKITIIQGEEIDVNFRSWVEMGRITEWSEDDETKLNQNDSFGDEDEEDDEDDEDYEDDSDGY